LYERGDHKAVIDTIFRELQIQAEKEFTKYNNPQPHIKGFEASLICAEGYQKHLEHLLKSLEEIEGVKRNSSNETTVVLFVPTASLGTFINFIFTNRPQGVEINITIQLENANFQTKRIHLPNSLQYDGPAQGLGFQTENPADRIRVFHIHGHFNSETETNSLRLYHALIKYVETHHPGSIVHRRTWYSPNGPHIKWSWEIHVETASTLTTVVSFLMSNKTHEYSSMLFHVRTRDINSKNEYDDHAFRLAWIGEPDSTFDVGYFKY